ncbi:hypothetical protein HDU76_008660 [Blyttiomyces sp. JEL0837]|nr:hypothetical protein HDU76_008660 [Blyttiomyces sp. JEL0837]
MELNISAAGARIAVAASNNESRGQSAAPLSHDQAILSRSRARCGPHKGKTRKSSISKEIVAGDTTSNVIAVPSIPSEKNNNLHAFVVGRKYCAKAPADSQMLEPQLNHKVNHLKSPSSSSSLDPPTPPQNQRSSVRTSAGPSTNLRARSSTPPSMVHTDGDMSKLPSLRPSSSPTTTAILPIIASGTYPTNLTAGSNGSGGNLISISALDAGRKSARNSASVSHSSQSDVDNNNINASKSSPSQSTSNTSVPSQMAKFSGPVYFGTDGPDGGNIVVGLEDLRTSVGIPKWVAELDGPLRSSTLDRLAIGVNMQRYRLARSARSRALLQGSGQFGSVEKMGGMGGSGSVNKTPTSAAPAASNIAASLVLGGASAVSLPRGGDVDSDPTVMNFEALNKELSEVFEQASRKFRQAVEYNRNRE